MSDSSPLSADDGDDPVEEIVVGAVSAVTFLVGFGLMFAGFGFFWVAFVIGFAGVLPMTLGLVRYYQRKNEDARPAVNTTDRADETADALDELRQRYARGELSDEEFDRRVERLLETESVPDARKYAERTETESLSKRRERELERE